MASTQPRDRDRVFALPVPLTPLVGRAREIAAVGRLLRQTGVRLVTLTGPGGVGKTRLAIEAASRGTRRFDGDACFVPLAAITDPGDVGPAIARALGVRPGGDRSLAAQLGAVLGARRRLVLLDNLEQVLDAAPLVAEILVACPGLTLLATSREPLHLSAEHECPVPPLSLRSEPRAGGRGKNDPAPRSRPASHVSEAAALFAQRAKAVSPGFAVTAANAAEIAALCARLDGLPLAIELAAARIKVFSPGALLARLDRAEGAGLELLTGGPRDAPPRLRTLREAIGWSHDLLTPAEQILFRRLAVFAGGFTLETAAIVGDAGEGRAPPVLDLVVSLVDKSLLRQLDPGVHEPRFGMLETVRAYALERLAASGEEDAVRDRHAAWCLDLTERVWTVLCGVAEEPLWQRRAETEHDNVRAALAWLERSGEGEGMLRLAVAVDRLWSLRGYRVEAITWLERAVRLAPDAPPALRAGALAGLGWHVARQGHYERARVLHEEALAIVRALDDPVGTAFALHNLGVVALNSGRFSEATRCFDEVTELNRRHGNAGGQHWIAYLRGITAYAQGDIAEASALVEAALAGHRALGEAWGVVVALDVLGLLACEQGQAERAAARLAEALPAWREIGNQEGLAEWLAAVARLAASRGRPVPAARLYGAAEALHDAAGVPQVVPPRHEYERVIAELRGALDPAAFAAAWAAGRALPLEDAIAAALAETASPPAAPAADPTPAGDARRNGSLTRREREVLRLVTEGRSDREIAAALFIGDRTVEWHLTNAFNKLGVNTRAAAVSAALRRGLI